MAIEESVTKYIHLPKKELIDFLEESFDTGMTPNNSHISLVDLTQGIVKYSRSLDESDETSVTYAIPLADLVSSILLGYDQQIQVSDIIDILTIDSTKITVEYS
jgi:hypothetical protein